jgi:exosortase
MISPGQIDRTASDFVAASTSPLPATRVRSVLAMIGLSALLVSFSGTLSGLVQQWWEYLNHGFALVALVVWAAWRDREQLLANVSPWRPAVVLVAGASLLWFVGASAEVQVVEQLALLAVLLSWTLGVLGLGNSRRLLRLAAYLFLAMPAWGFLIGVLQKITVLANSVLLAASGLEAKISGTFIAIPEGTFEVAGSCAGQAFLMSGLTIAVAYWEITPLSARGRWLALSLMAALSLCSNWIRVFLLILIGHWTNMQSPLIADHGWFGWVIFLVIVLLFLWLSRYIEARHGLPSALTSKTAAPRLDSADVSPIPQGRIDPTVLAAFTAVAIMGPVAKQVIQFVPRDASSSTIEGLQPGPAWTLSSSATVRPLAYGDSIPPSPWSPRFVGANRHIVQEWTRGTERVRVDRLLFSGADHRHKLFAEGNLIARPKNILADRLVAWSDGNQVRSLRQAIVLVDSSETRAALYWFRVGDTSTGLPLVGRMKQGITFVQRGPPPELIAVSMRCTTDCTAAFESLRDVTVGNGNHGAP